MSTVAPEWTELAEGLIEHDGELAPGVDIFLRASWCPSCDRYDFPYQEHCLACGGATEARRLSSNGRISQFTSVNHPPPGGLVEVPYSVAVVDFPEGISVLGLVEGVPDPAVLEFGDEVKVVAIDVGGSIGYAYRVVAA